MHRNNLSRVLREKGYTLDQLAEELKIPLADLDEIYLGRSEFSPEILERISAFLEVSRETLLMDARKNIYENIGVQLRQIREDKKITLMELGKKSGVSYTHISEIERGKTCASLKTLEKLAKVLEISTSYFFQLEESFTLGDKIRRLREKQNFTQIQLAERIGVSLSLIGQIETGRVKPALDTLQSIANVFGVSITYFLLTETEEMGLRQASVITHNNSYDKLNEIAQGLDQQDLSLVTELLNLLKKYNRMGLQDLSVDAQTRELLEIMNQLGEEDKRFVIDNAKWVLKKANGNFK
ncbi:MAG: helix-turn-helix domain-containing protein [Peptococcaceae bacterium]